MNRVPNYNNINISIIKKSFLILPLFFMFLLLKIVDVTYSLSENILIDENKKIISNIYAGMTVNNLMNKIDTDGDISVFDTNNKIIGENERLKTGYILKIVSSSKTVTYKISVTGDVDGNRVVDTDDVKKISKHRLHGNVLVESLYTMSADMNKDNKIDINDIILAVRYKEPAPVPPKYIIKYNTNGGAETIKNDTKTSGETLTLSSVKPTRAGYTFLGWSTSSSATEVKYASGGKYTTDASTTLYAVWKKNGYTVNFNLNGGSGNISSQSVDIGKTAQKPTSPTRNGFKFLGWYTSDKKEYNFTNSVNSNLTLYALWSPIIKYNALNDGKWMFINNPEMLDKTDYLADDNYGNAALYTDYFSGNAEIYYEHAVDGNIVYYYAIRFYNANSTDVTLSINKCGAETGWAPEGIIDYYFNNKCTAKGSYVIKPNQTLYIYHNDNSQVVGDYSIYKNIGKLPTDGIEGMISLSSSNGLYMSAVAFRDVYKTSNAVYKGNWTDVSSSGQNHQFVYSGYYNKLPIITNDVIIPIYDQTPSGDIPVSYTNNDGQDVVKSSWNTNLGGGYIYENQVYALKDVFVQDFINLVVPLQYDPYYNIIYSYKKLAPYNSSKPQNEFYNWANWAVHYKEKATIINNSSVSKTVIFNLNYDDGGLGKRVALSYNNVTVPIGTVNNYQVWSVTVPPGTTKTVEAEITLMGHSNGNLVKSFKLN